MKDRKNTELLADLFAKIERSWLDNQDNTIVRLLCEKYPDYREELCEFFEDLVLEPEEHPESEKLVHAEDRITHWLESTGFEIARNSAAGRASTTEGISNVIPASNDGIVSPKKSDSDSEFSSQPEPTSWLMLLRQRTKESVPNIVGKLHNVTTEFLILVSRHAQLVPLRTRTTLAQQIEESWGVPMYESLRYLNLPHNSVRAASRSRPFDSDPKTFEELLDRANLTKEQRLFWIKL